MASDINENGDRSVGGLIAFAGSSRIAAGNVAEVAAAARKALSCDPHAPIVVFDAATAEVVDLDLRANEQSPLAPPSPDQGAKRGRPKLGVVAREVTLLPRHWEWLGRQPGGASVALRKLVEAARKSGGEMEQARARAEVAYRFMAAMAGDLPDFENAARALFAGDLAELARRIAGWPPDISRQTIDFANGSDTRNKLGKYLP
jgi:hypothetical protein